MKAMIFAAGLGTRLRPLTNNRPKALVRVVGKPLLEIAINNLIKNGFKEIIINVHHFADQIVDFIEQKNKFGIKIEISDEREEVLETGGGLKKAAWFFDDAPFLVYNTDIISNIDLKKMYAQHLDSGALATLAVRQRSTSRYFIFNEDNLLSGWCNTKTGEMILKRKGSNFQMKAFSGIHIIDPEIFKHMPEEGPFSIVKTYLKLAGTHQLKPFTHDDSVWVDVGKPENIEQAKKIVQELF